jgi:hypothetical protein
MAARDGAAASPERELITVEKKTRPLAYFPEEAQTQSKTAYLKSDEKSQVS